MTLKDYKTGITGNMYFTSCNKQELEDICKLIGKSTSSIYWSRKYKTYAIRIKNKRLKHFIRGQKDFRLLQTVL